jgi:hypothetical protein
LEGRMNGLKFSVPVFVTRDWFCDGWAHPGESCYILGFWLYIRILTSLLCLEALLGIIFWKLFSVLWSLGSECPQVIQNLIIWRGFLVLGTYKVTRGQVRRVWWMFHSGICSFSSKFILPEVLYREGRAVMTQNPLLQCSFIFRSLFRISFTVFSVLLIFYVLLVVSSPLSFVSVAFLSIFTRNIKSILCFNTL